MKKKVIGIIGIIILLLLGTAVLILKKNNFFAKDEWSITQYGPRDINSSFYIIYNPKKGVIVVDGGWREDAVYVRSVIESLGNKVEAWILTHPHQDHIGAFNEIYPNLQGIEVKSVYTVDMATPECCMERASWDSVDSYVDFLELEVEDLQYVYTGDVLEICGLQIEILNAYGKHVEQYSYDYINDGSMMFKVTNKEESMLFCADVGVSVSDYLLEYWGEKINVDYIQMGHHGYGGLNDSFYQMASPKVVFFDAPDSMMADTTGRYDNPEHVRLMEGMGCEVRSFHTMPNTVFLK